MFLSNVYMWNLCSYEFILLTLNNFYIGALEDLAWVTYIYGKHDICVITIRTHQNDCKHHTNAIETLKTATSYALVKFIIHNFVFKRSVDIAIFLPFECMQQHCSKWIFIDLVSEPVWAEYAYKGSWTSWCLSGALFKINYSDIVVFTLQIRSLFLFSDKLCCYCS